jgi:hypothetical protein
MQRNERERRQDGVVESGGRRLLLTQAMAGLGALTLPTALASAAGDATGHDRARNGRRHPENPQLRSLLERNHWSSPQFGGGLSNHVSLGRLSLSALGANDERLVRFARSEGRALEPWPEGDGSVVTSQSWRAQLGRTAAFSAYRAFFASEILRAGREPTLRAYLPGLMPGVAAGAFHALIRTAYGVRFGDDREIADGLAYWATAFLPLAALGPAGEEREPRAVLARMASETSLANATLPKGLIFPRMSAAAALPAFGPLASSLGSDEQTLSGIAAAVLELYLGTGDFIALHAVTATHAYRVLSPFLEPSALRYHFQAIAAAFVSIGAPRLGPPSGSAAPPWPQIVGRTLDSVDAHDIKLVDIAREEEAHYHQPLYRRAAAQRMRMI